MKYFMALYASASLLINILLISHFKEEFSWKFDLRHI